MVLMLVSLVSFRFWVILGVMVKELKVDLK